MVFHSIYALLFNVVVYAYMEGYNLLCLCVYSIIVVFDKHFSLKNGFIFIIPEI